MVIDRHHGGFNIVSEIDITHESQLLKKQKTSPNLIVRHGCSAKKNSKGTSEPIENLFLKYQVESSFLNETSQGKQFFYFRQN